MTPAQLQALKTEINADAVLAAQPMVGDGPNNIAVALNQIDVPVFLVWRTNVGAQEIFDAISWAIYTPADAVDNVGLPDALTAQRVTTRLMAIQTKQLNLQNMLIGRQSLDFSKANIRSGIQDAVVQVPSGAGGALRAPGGAQGATVLGVGVRNATRAERVLIKPGGQVATGGVAASVLGFEGAVTVDDVVSARNS
jgi:hypothetical protein